MSQEPVSVGESEPLPLPAAGAQRLRVEDVVLTVMVALIGHALVAAQGPGGGLFDGNRPLDGVVRLGGLAGAFACLATRSSDDPHSTSERPILQSGAIGPLVGGLMLVGGSGFAALNLAPEAIFGPTFLIVLILALAGDHLPAVPTAMRRNFVTLFLIAAGGLFWSFVNAIVGGMDVIGEFSRAWSENPSQAEFVGGALVAMAAVFYAMLVFAPRQLVEREGSPLTWLLRFALFIVGVSVGVGWISVLGG